MVIFHNILDNPDILGFYNDEILCQKEEVLNILILSSNINIEYAYKIQSKLSDGYCIKQVKNV